MSLTGDVLARIALDAGAIIMQVYATDFDVTHKGDTSPVTEADEKAEALILAALAEADPTLPVIAEEAVAAGQIPEHGSRFALVDPLDGTREFVKKNGNFTVNIGIIENGVPVMGVVYAAALNRLFVAESRFSAWEAEVAPGEPVPPKEARKKLRIRSAPASGLTAFASQSHRSAETDAFLKAHAVDDIVAVGSSLKFGLIAAGEADLYPRLGPTNQWDTAAGHAVAEAAGARVTREDGRPLLYGKTARAYENPNFIVWADVAPPVPG